MSAQEEIETQLGTFEYEDCSNCGQGVEGHMAAVDPLGHGHVICKDDAY